MKNTAKTTAERPQPGYVRPQYRNSHRKKKIGFDLHGVVDAKVTFFRCIMRDLILQGWEVHILTGAPWSKERKTLHELRIPFTHFFSIVDHHQAIGTKIKWDRKGNAHFDDYLWNQTKAIYCKAHGITVHFDDSDIYGFFFQTPYVRYYSKDSIRDKKRHLC